MVTVLHKFRTYKNNENIEILMLGTFNPDTPGNPAEFFYGRSKNFLWNLLPKVFGYKELKSLSVSEKEKFMQKYNIGFADIIEEVTVESGEETNYADSYLDSKVTKWTDLELVLKKHPNLKEVFFTRKSFSDIPNMKAQIDRIKEICLEHHICFSCLPTPARFQNEQKLTEWISIIKT